MASAESEASHNLSASLGQSQKQKRKTETGFTSIQFLKRFKTVVCPNELQIIKMIRTCFLLILFTSLAASSKLNVPRVLLPISAKTPVNFTLEVSDGGCYTW